MALPLSRNITLADGDPIRHADLNDFQDQIIALNSTLHLTDRTLALGGADATLFAVGATVDGNANLAVTHNNPSSFPAFWTIPLLSGKRLKRYRASVTDNATSSTVLTFGLRTKTGSAVSSASETVASAGSGAVQVLSKTLASPLTFVAGTAVLLTFLVSQNQPITVHWVEFLFDDP